MNPDAVEQPVEALPSWFVVTLVGALAAIVGFGTIGLALAVLGAFSPFPTFVLGGAATAAIVRAVAPWRAAATHDRGAQVPALLAVVLAIASAAFAGLHHAEHVLVDRDPGGYVVIARWLATHHDLRAYARVGAFRHAVGLYYFSPAVYDRYSGHLYFQFSHFFPTLLAEARWIGGDGLMFVLPALLGALGARVVITNEACARRDGVPNSDRSADCNNRLRRSVAAANRAQLVDLFDFVCPRGHCRVKQDGVALRADGMHYEGPGGNIVAKWLIDQVRSPR